MNLKGGKLVDQGRGKKKNTENRRSVIREIKAFIRTKLTYQKTGWMGHIGRISRGTFFLNKVAGIT